MLDIKTDLISGPWQAVNIGTGVRVTSPEQPHHAFAMLYIKTGGRGGKPCAKMRATAAVMLAAPAMYQALLSAEIAAAELCQGQDPANECWNTLRQIRDALELATKEL